MYYSIQDGKQSNLTHTIKKYSPELPTITIPKGKVLPIFATGITGLSLALVLALSGPQPTPPTTSNPVSAPTDEKTADITNASATKPDGDVAEPSDQTASASSTPAPSVRWTTPAAKPAAANKPVAPAETGDSGGRGAGESMPPIVTIPEMPNVPEVPVPVHDPVTPTPEPETPEDNEPIIELPMMDMVDSLL